MNTFLLINLHKIVDSCILQEAIKATGGKALGGPELEYFDTDVPISIYLIYRFGYNNIEVNTLEWRLVKSMYYDRNAEQNYSILYKENRKYYLKLVNYIKRVDSLDKIREYLIKQGFDKDHSAFNLGSKAYRAESEGFLSYMTPRPLDTMNEAQVKTFRSLVYNKPIGGQSLIWEGKPVPVVLIGSPLNFIGRNKSYFLYPNSIKTNVLSGKILIKPLTKDSASFHKALTDEQVAKRIYKEDEKEFHRIVRLVSKVHYVQVASTIRREGFGILRSGEGDAAI